MKKYILFVFMIAVIGSLVFVPGCKRTDLADPDIHEHAGFIINLSGVANPGLLFVSQGTSPAVSYLNTTALYNNGTPVSGKNIVFKISDDIGYFPGGSRTAVRTTNSQGKTSIQYSVTHLAIDKIGADKLVYIQALMQVDLYNVWEIIPLQLVTNMPDDGANQLAITLVDTGVDPLNVPNLGPVTLNYLVFNSKGTDAISFLVTIPAAAATWITSSVASGTTDSTITFTVADNSTFPTRSTTITITATAPADVFNQTETITINQL